MRLFVLFLNIYMIIYFSSFVSANEICEKNLKSDFRYFSISLEKALTGAFKNNPDIKASLYDVSLKKAEYKNSLSGFYPEISTWFEYSRGDSPSSYLFKTIDQRKLPGDTDFNDPGEFDNFEAGISAKMRIYNGGMTSGLKSASEKMIKASEFMSLEIKNSISFQVVSFWYDLLSAKDFVDISRESVSIMEEQVRITQVKFKGGSALKSDLLSLKARLAESKETFLKAENIYKITEAELASVMGIDPCTEFVFQDDSGLKGNFISSNYGNALKKAFLNRPFYLAVKEETNISKVNLKKEKGGYLPVLDLKADYYHDDPDMEFSKSRENWRAGLVCSWKIFDGFSTRSKVEKADAIIGRNIENEKKATLLIKKEIRTAWLNISLARERLKVSLDRKKEAEASFELVKKQYAGGSVNITRYLESELSLSRAKTARVKAFYDSKKAEADMKRAIGILWRIVK